MKKIIAIVLLLIGIGLSGFAALEYFFTESFMYCQRDTSEAERKLNEARAAEGTPREAEASWEARIAVSGQIVSCRIARQLYEQIMLMGLGGLALIIVSVVLLVSSRMDTVRG